MAITPSKDKIAIQAILSTDPYLVDYLGFNPREIYRVRATDEILGTADSKNTLKNQIFIYNTTPEQTINPVIHGAVYQIDVSVPYAKNGTADLAIEQIIGLLQNREVSGTHELEIIDLPTVLSSETSLYQVGIRFIIYESIYTKPKTYVKESEE